ncbi:hydrogenase maturation protease [bacterium]|nr:hydrogenase maturation protease [bacterium]NIN92051.1 hydrogenase maturation protease [bacterium]NIO18264.1 hydrogenase maturation protease [bacterium]NIO73238.1 hydrogenase maturation protease [bacterium]
MELAKLKNRLQGKVSLVGIGNPLRGDDGVGPEIISRVKDLLPSLFLFDVGEAPENYLGKIVKQKPDTIVLIDAVDFNAPPGTIKIMEKDDIKDESLSTHKVSLNLVAKYLYKETSADVFVLGIQPETTEFGREISRPVREGLEKIIRMLERV